MLSWLTESIDSKPLGAARIIVGAAALVRGFVAWGVMSRLLEPGVVRVPYAGWLPEPSPWLIGIIVLFWIAASIAFLVGWRVTVSGLALLAAIATTLFLDQQTYSNHLYLMAWLVLLMVVADAGAGLSFGSKERSVQRWTVILLMAQGSVVYLFSGLTKLNTDFLSGRVLASVLYDGLVPFPDPLRTPGILAAMAALVVAVELFLAVFLWRRRFRPIALAVGFMLHTGITLFMSATTELLVFSMQMLALYPLFLAGTGDYERESKVSSPALP